MSLSHVHRWLYAFVLAAGAAAAIFVIAHGWSVYAESTAKYGSDWFRFDGWRVLECGSGAVALIVTLAFYLASLQRTLHWAAVPIYIVSYVACALTSGTALLIAGKDFDAIGVIATLVQVGPVWFGPAAALSIVGLAFLVRSSRRTSPHC